MAFSDKPSTQDASNKQSLVETKINTFELDAETGCISQNMEQLTSSTASAISQREMITGISEEKFTESRKETDFEKDLGSFSEKGQEGDSASNTLQSTSLVDSSAFESENIFSVKMKKLMKSLGEIDDLSEKVQQSKSESPSSISQSETKASTSKEKCTESLKEMDLKKYLSNLTFKVKEDDSALDLLQSNFVAYSPAFESEKIFDIQMKKCLASLQKTDIKDILKNLPEIKSEPVSSVSESETITSTSEEKFTESLKETDFEKDLGSISEKVQEGDSASNTLQSTSIADSAAFESEKIFSIKMKKFMESLKEIGIEDLSEKVQESKSESAARQPISLEASSSRSKNKSSRKRKNPTVSSKDIDFEKSPGAISEEVEEGESASRTLGMFFESINIGAMISTNHFLTKRLPYLRTLVDEAVKLQTFLENVNNLRHEFQACSHTSLSCLTMIPKQWIKFTRDYEIFLKQIRTLIETTNAIMQQCCDNSLITREEFATYLDNLLVVSEDLDEMEEFCDEALTNYRPICFNYDNYLFALHVSTLSPHLKPLQDRLKLECGKFSSFEAEIGEQIKQLKGNIDELL